jgi:hypothetical protein
MPAPIRAVVDRIAENCEPALCTVLFMGGAGGSLRAGVTENPVRLTRSVKDLITRVTCGGAPVYVWPGGGITLMVDVLRMPDRSFGYVPTPALVLPIEFTLTLDAYAGIGGHLDRVVPIEQALRDTRFKTESWRAEKHLADATMSGPARAMLPGNRLHLQHGPIDLVVEAWGERARSNSRTSRRGSVSTTSCRRSSPSFRFCAPHSPIFIRLRAGLSREG